MATSTGCRRLDAGDLPARRHPHGMTFPWAKSGAASTRLKPSSTRVDWDRLERLGCSVRSPATSFAATGARPRGGNRYKAPFEPGWDQTKQQCMGFAKDMTVGCWGSRLGGEELPGGKRRYRPRGQPWNRWGEAEAHHGCSGGG